jgi:uncharacterized protein
VIVVADASPLIALAGIGRVEILRDVYADVVVPPAVHQEAFARRGRPVPTWIQIRAPMRPVLADVSSGGLGLGEREAIALAVELHADLLLVDDRDARRAALAAGLRIAGTMAVLLRAKRAGHVPAVRPILDALVADGFHVAPALRAAVLRDAGE